MDLPHPQHPPSRPEEGFLNTDHPAQGFLTPLRSQQTGSSSGPLARDAGPGCVLCQRPATSQIPSFEDETEDPGGGSFGQEGAQRQGLPAFALKVPSVGGTSQGHSQQAQDLEWDVDTLDAERHRGRGLLTPSFHVLDTYGKALGLAGRSLIR